MSASATLETDIYDGVSFVPSMCFLVVYMRCIDLYGDNAGNDEQDTLNGSQTGSSEAVDKAVKIDASSERDAKPATNGSSLPAKPSQSTELSYSAQVAKQFSAYKQTPAQERQQRTQTVPASTSKIPTAATDTEASSGEIARARPTRPSEMKDEG